MMRIYLVTDANGNAAAVLSGEDKSGLSEYICEQLEATGYTTEAKDLPVVDIEALNDQIRNSGGLAVLNLDVMAIKPDEPAE